MSSTEETPAPISAAADPIAEMAGKLYDTIVAPLAAARQKRGTQAYFALGADASAASYYDAPRATKMSAADFEFPGKGTAEGLVDALVALWQQEGEQELVSLGPGLKEIAKVLREQDYASDGTVSVLCYTMF